MAERPAIVAVEVACLIREAVESIVKELKTLNYVTSVGLRDVQVKAYTLQGDGTVVHVLKTAQNGKPRKVLLVVDSHIDEPECSLAVSPLATVSVEAGPTFALGATHDFGLVPATLELYASQKPVSGAAVSTLNLWVWTFF